MSNITYDTFYVIRPQSTREVAQDLDARVTAAEERLNQLQAAGVPDDDYRMRLAALNARILIREAEELTA